jgi:hypothetical protein
MKVRSGWGSASRSAARYASAASAGRSRRRSSSARAMWNCGQCASRVSSGPRMASPAVGWPAMATATARLASVTAVGSYLTSSPYKAAIWRQSVSSGPSPAPAPAGTEWQAAMAACSWYGPGRRAASARVSSASPSAMSSRSQRPRFCSASGTSSPAPSSLAARRASVSSSRASSPAASGSPGSSAASARASLMAWSHSSPRISPGPPAARCPWVKTR